MRALAHKLRTNGFSTVAALRDHVGLLYLVAAQASLVLLGYVTNVFVARSLGPSGAGRFGVVMSILVWVEVLIIDGAPQALRKFIAQDPKAAGTIIRRTLRPQFALVACVFVVAFLFSPLVASLLHDSSYTVLFRIAYVDILLYGAYWYVNGVLHGLKRFSNLFWMISAYALGKCVLIIGLVLAGFGVRGALLGNALASLVGAAVGLGFVLPKHLPTAEWEKRGEFWHFSRWNILYGLLTSLLPSVDLWLVRYFGTDYTAGLYSIAASVARVPYFLAIAFVSFALPSLASHANAGGERNDELGRSWRTTLGLALGAFLPLVVLVEIFADPLVIGIFGQEYAGSVPLLRILFPGSVFYSLFLLENTRSMALRGMGGPMRVVVPVTVLTVAAVAYGAGRFGPSGAAAAFGLSMLVGYGLSKTA